MVAVAPARGFPSRFRSRSRPRFWREPSAEWIIPYFELADQNLVAQIHDAGKRVMVWTVNDPQRMRDFATWGADAIISDDTELLVRSFA